MRRSESAGEHQISPLIEQETGLLSQTDPKTARIKVLKNLYDCLQCPAYCCSYTRIDVTKRDIARLARHFDLEPEVAEKKFTKLVDGHKALRHQKDKIFGTICQFIDKDTRRCTVYEARPSVCRTYPETRRCGYYDFLSWEREHQEDKDFIPYELG